MLLDSDSKQWLQKTFGNRILFDESMSRHTSLRVGGPADAYVAPENMETLLALIDWSRKKRIPYTVIGDGTNLLVKDKGIRGIVIVLTKCLNKITRNDNGQDQVMVTALAGVRMNRLCWFAIKSGFEGMNFALGIPGTVGGGILMNAGTGYGWVANVLDSIRVLLPTGETQGISRKDLNFSYRKLTWSEEQVRMCQGPCIILDGCFQLHPSDPRKLKKEAITILADRKKKQPTRYPSAGCFFKNPASGKTAGELIDLAGLKAKRIGGAVVSSKHANFIINTGTASAADVLALMKHVQTTVFEAFKVNLEPEVKIVGT
jgi:UDP-N-acetylmuramate dehydrogenase